MSLSVHLSVSLSVQEEQNRGKPNWEHLNEDLHVLITVEDSQNRAEIKLKRAVDEVNKLLVPAVSHMTSDLYIHINIYTLIYIYIYAYFSTTVQYKYVLCVPGGGRGQPEEDAADGVSHLERDVQRCKHQTQ